jgi:RNA polymerase sigma factor for flagellar operon FliA
VLRGNCPDLQESEIIRLGALLPQRPARTDVSIDKVDTLSSDMVVDPPGLLEADQQRLAAVEEVIRTLVGSLSPEDATIMRMRFWGGFSIAHIARALRLEQKPLYRRLEHLKSKLRTELEARGVDQAVAAEVLSGDLGQ